MSAIGGKAHCNGSCLQMSAFEKMEQAQSDRIRLCPLWVKSGLIGYGVDFVAIFPIRSRARWRFCD
jgi:hypothetical protein